MKLERILRTVLLISSLGFASQSGAATVSYILDQSNRLGDGLDYLKVSISDDTTGQLDFRVEPQPDLMELAGDNLDIFSFAFNLNNDGKSGADLVADAFILPDDWKVKVRKGWGGQRPFDVRMFGWDGGNEASLHFSVLGLTLDDIGNEFAAHVAGLAIPGKGCMQEYQSDKRGCKGHSGRALIYGGRPSEIPVPPAVWLMASGLLGLAGVARRRSA